MALAYIRPGVSVSEIVSPSFSPVLLDPNSICIVGPSQGFQTAVENFLLADNTPVQLAALGINPSTIVVRDASNVTLAPFTAGASADYTVDTSNLSTTGYVKISRSMQTRIANGEKVVVYLENSAGPGQGDAHTELLELDNTTAEAPVNRASTTQAASVSVQRQGSAPAADYTLANVGAVGTSIVWRNTATVLKQFQVVYVTYTVSGVTSVDVAKQLNALTTVSLPDNATAITVNTAPGLGTSASQAIVYTAGTTTDNDYILGGSGATTTIARSAGTTTIGSANDKLAVRVTYNYTPATYWLPTRCYSQYDVELQYGAAFDSSGNILTPVSYAASLAFANGANSVIIQPLFAAGSPNTQPTGSVSDWDNTLANLYNIEDINLVVPLISTGGLSTSDAQNLEILEAVQNYIAYMQNVQNQYVMAICGEDATGGVMASPTTLQTHAESLGANTPYDESVVVLSPGSFQFQNPVTGLPTNVGGQYVAAAIAGMCSRYPVQQPLTRKRINNITSVNVARTEQQKDQDAQAGLLVVEDKKNVIRVRDAITTSQTSQASRSMSVVRAKHWMMDNIREALDDQVVGQIVLDNQANFRVQLVVQNELELMSTLGAIVTYDQIQVTRDPNDSTAMQVRFSYLPTYPLNRVEVSFSIDQSSGVSFSTTGSTVTGL